MSFIDDDTEHQRQLHPFLPTPRVTCCAWLAAAPVRLERCAVPNAAGFVASFQLVGGRSPSGRFVSPKCNKKLHVHCRIRWISKQDFIRIAVELSSYRKTILFPREIKLQMVPSLYPLERFTAASDFKHISGNDWRAFSQATRSQFSPGKDGRSSSDMHTKCIKL